MKEKLDFLLKNKGLTATTLARMLDIQPSGISHILSGRNKPSFDLVQKILRAFPDINPDWLLLDSDVVFRSGEAATPSGDHVLSASLFDKRVNSEISESNSNAKNEEPSIFALPKNGAKGVERIVIFYADGSFDSYTPR